MAGITLDECIEQFDLAAEDLDEKCSDEHILAVSRFLDWKGVAPYLNLTDSEVDAVDSDGRDEPDKRHKTLQKWKSKFAFKATYKNLIQALLKSCKGDHAEEVCKLLQKGTHNNYYCSWHEIFIVLTLRFSTRCPRFTRSCSNWAIWREEC